MKMLYNAGVVLYVYSLSPDGLRYANGVYWNLPVTRKVAEQYDPKRCK
jgi:hypothetical protein